MLTSGGSSGAGAKGRGAWAGALFSIGATGARADFLSSVPVRPMIVTMSGEESSPALLTPRQRFADGAEFLEISRITAATSAKVREAGPER